MADEEIGSAIAPEVPASPEPSEEDKARIEKYAPLLAVVQSDAFSEVLDGLRGVTLADFMDDLGFAHLHSIISTMPRLKTWVEQQSS